MTTAGEAWLEEWQAQPLEQLTARLARWGADEPESWAGSELDGNIPQTARYLVLREMWDGAVAVRDDAAEQIDTLQQQGALTRERIEYILADQLYVFLFNLAYLLDEPDGTTDQNGNLMHVDEDGPRWRLMEVAPNGELTGRDVGGLHESVMSTAPGGEEAAHEAGWF